MNSFAVQFERLRRHFDVAVHTYDEVSFLDLAHTLRVWVDAKRLVRSSAPEFSRSIKFKACQPSSKAIKILKSREYVYSLFSSGVTTYASQNHNVVGFLDSTRKGNDIQVSASVRFEDGGLNISSYTYWTGKLDIPDDELFHDQRTRHCTFEEWLNSQVVLGAMRSEQGIVPFSLTHENLIRRVANEFDASHPTGMAVPNSALEASRATHYLMGHIVAGLPLPYFLLLKDAYDIIEVGKKFFGKYGKISHANPTM